MMDNIPRLNLSLLDTLADLASKEITPHEYTGNKNNNSNNSSNNSNIDDKNNNNITGYKRARAYSEPWIQDSNNNNYNNNIWPSNGQFKNQPLYLSTYNINNIQQNNGSGTTYLLGGNTNSAVDTNFNNAMRSPFSATTNINTNTTDGNGNGNVDGNNNHTPNSLILNKRFFTNNFNNGNGSNNNGIQSSSSSSSTSSDTAGIDNNMSLNESSNIPAGMLERYSSVYNKSGRIGVYTREERSMIIRRFYEKRKKRVWKKKIRYHCRKHLADRRLRVKGRFIKAGSAEAIALGLGGGDDDDDEEVEVEVNDEDDENDDDDEEEGDGGLGREDGKDNKNTSSSSSSSSSTSSSKIKPTIKQSNVKASNIQQKQQQREQQPKQNKKRSYGIAMNNKQNNRKTLKADTEITTTTSVFADMVKSPNSENAVRSSLSVLLYASNNNHDDNNNNNNNNGDKSDNKFHNNNNKNNNNRVSFSDEDGGSISGGTGINIPNNQYSNAESKQLNGNNNNNTTAPSSGGANTSTGTSMLGLYLLGRAISTENLAEKERNALSNFNTTSTSIAKTEGMISNNNNNNNTESNTNTTAAGIGIGIGTDTNANTTEQSNDELLIDLLLSSKKMRRHSIAY